MAVYEIVFSPTGGTKKIADAVACGFATATVIDLCEFGADCAAYRFTPDDLCIVAVPAFGRRAPAAAITRLEQMVGNAAMAVAVVSYGNIAYGDTLCELADTLSTAGFRCVAGIAAVAEHSILRQFASGRPDAADIAELYAFGAKIREAIGARDIAEELELPGNRPYKDRSAVPIKPRTGKGCTSCGLCAKRCPVGAIPAGNPSRTDEKRCISCMRCVAVCPAHVRKISRVMLTIGAVTLAKAAAGFRANELFL
ncbi:MAG: 4Fe-4S binding protein [Clostridiaceae bacterium]|nr:4Fe-4S binding protein [Clostridiaceae bacterium]